MTKVSKTSSSKKVIGPYCMNLGSKNFKGKLRKRWLGPYEVNTIFPNGTVRLLTIDDSKTPLLINGHRLCLYQCPISKEDFKATCMVDSHYLFLEGFSTPHCN
jgi:hypothetical protein